MEEWRREVWVGCTADIDSVKYKDTFLPSGLWSVTVITWQTKIMWHIDPLLGNDRGIIKNMAADTE
jgi:hypothetical protein